MDITASTMPPRKDNIGFYKRLAKNMIFCQVKRRHVEEYISLKHSTVKYF
jgi:hypothetical protein